MSKNKASDSLPNNKVKAQYFNRSTGISTGKSSRHLKNGKAQFTGASSVSSMGNIPDVLPSAPFPHLKGKP